MYSLIGLSSIGVRKSRNNGYVTRRTNINHIFFSFVPNRSVRFDRKVFITHLNNSVFIENKYL